MEIQNDEERLNYAKKIVESSQKAKEIISEKEIKLILNILRKYNLEEKEIENLMQNLVQSIEKSNTPEKFNTRIYISWWIRQEIIKYITQNTSSNKIPVYVVENINKLNKTVRKLTIKLDREPTKEEIAKEMEISVQEVENIQKDLEEYYKDIKLW